MSKKGRNTYPPRPKLPPKVIFNNFSPKLMEQRRVALARYLRYLYLNPFTRSSVSFLSFIAAERIITHYQSFTPDSGMYTPAADKGGGGRQKQQFFHTPEAGNKDVLTSFPYAFRSTRGGLDSFAGWDSERKNRKKNKDER